MDIHFRVWCRSEKKMYYRGYQKLTHVLLCDDDAGSNEGKGKPVKRASFDDCEFLEGTGVFTASGQEIFEGDIVQVDLQNRILTGTVKPIPDMYRSRNLHPMQSLLEEWGVHEDIGLSFNVVGNVFENPEWNGKVK